MKIKDYIDYIIVGRGIAGSVLAWELINRGKHVIIIDKGGENATKVASGIINPITGRNYVKTWMADETISSAVSFYGELENYFHKNFIEPVSIFKLFYSSGNRNDWSLRSGSSEYNRFLKDKNIIYLDKNKVKNDFGSFTISNTYKLNTIQFLISLENYFTSKEILINENFDFNNLIVKEDSVQYKNIKAGKIIFCEGYQGKFNPYFNYLPFNPAKGECLYVKINDYYNDRVISGNYFTIPLDNDLYYLGSTNYWKFEDALPSDDGKEELIDGLRSLIPLPFSVISHRAAIRPTVKDRKPFIGLHPAHSQLGIFNGLGTKGISLAPFFASHFVEFLENSTPLRKEVDIKRFLK